MHQGCCKDGTVRRAHDHPVRQASSLDRASKEPFCGSPNNELRLVLSRLDPLDHYHSVEVFVKLGKYEPDAS